MKHVIYAFLNGMVSMLRYVCARNVLRCTNNARPPNFFKKLPKINWDAAPLLPFAAQAGPSIKPLKDLQ
jgi:hypothetical protein